MDFVFLAKFSRFRARDYGQENATAEGMERMLVDSVAPGAGEVVDDSALCGRLAGWTKLPIPRLARPVVPVRRPSVSVVVPCYNYGHFLPSCVGSILAQPGVDVEVMIVDDASPDGSGQVAQRLADEHERVSAILHQENRGHIATYNEGLDAVTGDYVVLLSADDLLTPGALTRATALMEAYPHVGMVYGHSITLTGDEIPPARTTPSSWSIWAGSRWIETMCRTGRNNLASPEAVLRMSVQRRIGGYRRDLPHSGDMEMWMRAAAVAGVGRVNGADQAYYRVHPASMFRTRYGVALADLEGRIAAFEAALGPGAEYRVPDADALLSRARRSLARDAVRHAIRVLDQEASDVDPIEPYIALARSLDPHITQRTCWASLAFRRRRTGHTISGRVVRRVGLVGHDMGDRARWRVGRWSGV